MRSRHSLKIAIITLIAALAGFSSAQGQAGSAPALSSGSRHGTEPIVTTGAPAGLIRELAGLVKDFPGEAPVVVALETSQGPRTLQFGPDYRVQPVPDFFAEAKALLGEAAVA